MSLTRSAGKVRSSASAASAERCCCPPWEEVGCASQRLASGEPRRIKSQSQKVICNSENLRTDFNDAPLLARAHKSNYATAQSKTINVMLTARLPYKIYLSQTSLVDC